MAHKVICIQPLHPEGMKILHASPDLEVIVPDSPDPATWANFLPGAEAICVRLTDGERSIRVCARAAGDTPTTSAAAAAAG